MKSTNGLSSYLILLHSTKTDCKRRQVFRDFVNCESKLRKRKSCAPIQVTRASIIYRPTRLTQICVYLLNEGPFGICKLVTNPNSWRAHLIFQQQIITHSWSVPFRCVNKWASRTSGDNVKRRIELQNRYGLGKRRFFVFFFL